MFNEIAIVLEDTDPPRFRLAEDGSPPPVTSAAIVDIATEQPIWWLVPASFVTVLPFTMDVSQEEIEALADEEPIDPIEDLPSSDPRHQAAIAARDSANETMFPVLKSLTYGVVPSGFRQVSPENGVNALVPGKAYSLTIMGPGGHGHIAFHV